MRNFMFILAIGLGCATRSSASEHLSAAVPADSGKARLFDLSVPLFPAGSDANKATWEKEFIAAGEAYEKDPQSFITRAVGWLGLGGAASDLSYYRSNYAWSSGNYYYYFFKDPTQTEIFYTREAMEDAYLLNHIDRSGDNILALWAMFGSFIKPMVLPHMGVGKPERRYIVNLLEAWKCIRSIENYEQKLTKIYEQISDEKVGAWDHETYIKPIRCHEFDERITVNSSYYLTWYYTFWVRRHHEGSTNAVYKILSDLLRANYQN